MRLKKLTQRGEKPSLLRCVHPWGSAGPKLVLAHADSDYRTDARRHFRRLGVEFAAAGSAEETHRLTGALEPLVVVLDADLPDESGYLTCAKIKAAHPDCKVIVVGGNQPDEGPRFARFAGAEAFVDHAQGLDILVHRVLEVAC